MPCSYRILPKDNLVVIAHYGTITTDENIATLRHIRSDPEARDDQDYLVDFSRVTTFDMDFRRMLAHVNRLQEQVPHGAGTATAIVAPGDVGFGLARMYQSLAEGRLPFRIGVFRSRPEAMAFLGRPDAPRFRTDIEAPPDLP